MLILTLLVALTSGLISCLSCWAMRRWAPQLGFMDQPGGHKQHANPVPLGGGLSIVLGVLGPVLAGTIAVYCLPADRLATFLPADVMVFLNGMRGQIPLLWLWLGIAVCLSGLGHWDDMLSVSWQFRLLAQLTLALVFVYFNPERITLFVDWAAFHWIITAVWIAGLINCFNMLDNMDGLTGGTAAIVGASFALLAALPPHAEQSGPQYFLVLLLMLLCGALGGFLVHNKTPARIYMGDSGSYFVGAILAFASIQMTWTSPQTSAGQHLVLAPIFLLAIPLYDMVSVMGIRMWHGQSVFQGDQRHFSHRLVKRGLSKGSAVATIWALTAVTCGLGVGLKFVETTGAFILLGCLLALLIAIPIYERSRVD